MIPDPESKRDRRFACTMCGACCNRSPELLLSEAAGLADMFVFRLMFRFYDLPRAVADYLACGDDDDRSAAAFYERKRLLGAFSVGKPRTKRSRNGKSVEYSTYLTVSALTLDTAPGACSALEAGRCTIYQRRPLSCRSVPFHYSRPEASAAAYLGAFVATPGHACDTGEDAPLVLEAGRIVDSGAIQARADALALAARDRRWAEAILRRVKADHPSYGLPSIAEIESNAAFGATTVSMRVAWQIGVEAGVIGEGACAQLIAAQAQIIDRQLGKGKCSPAARQTLLEMRAEYREIVDSTGFGVAGKPAAHVPWTSAVGR